MATENTDLTLPDNFFDANESKVTDSIENKESNNLVLPDNFLDEKKPIQDYDTLSNILYNPIDNDDVDYDLFPELREVFDSNIIKEIASTKGFNDKESQLVADLSQTTLFSNIDRIIDLEEENKNLLQKKQKREEQRKPNRRFMYSDATPLVLSMAYVKNISRGISGIQELFGKEDSYLKEVNQFIEKNQTDALMEALEDNNINLFYGRSINKTATDVGSNLLLMGKMMQGVNGLLKGKKLSLIAKGKTYKELFKVTTARSAFMGAYTFLTSSGSIEERGKEAALMMGMSATPLVTGLAKTNFKAIVADIIGNVAITKNFRMEDAEARARNMAVQTAGKGATEDEIFEIEKHYLISEMIQNYGPDIVFGSMTRAVQGEVKLGGYVFKRETVKGEKLSTKNIRDTVKKGEDNPYMDLVGRTLTDTDLAPTKAKETVFDPEGGQTAKERQKQDKKIIKERKKEIQKKESEKRKKIYDEIKTNLENVPKRFKTKQPKDSKKQKITSDPKKDKNIGTQIMREFSMMDELADFLDGGKAKYDGVAHKALVDNRRQADANALKMTRNRRKAFDENMKLNKMSNRKLAKKITFFKGFEKATLSELMGVYAKTKQEGGREAILQGNFKGNEEALNAAIKYVENNLALKNLADHIIADYAKTRSRMADTYERVEGKALGDIDYYTPLNRVDVQFKNGLDDIKSMIEGKEFSPKVTTTATKERVNFSRNEVNLDLVGEWSRMTSKTEHYIHQAENVKLYNNIVKNLGSDIKSTFGESMVKEIEAYTKRVANPETIYKTDSNVAKVGRTLRKNISIGYLAFNIKTGLKQVPSYFYYLQDLGGTREGFTRLTESVIRTAANWTVVDGKLVNAQVKFAEMNDPILKNTTPDTVINEFRNKNPNGYEKIVNKIGIAGFKHIVAMDKIVRVSGWNAVYKKALANGKTEQEAIRLARNSTARTQPTNIAADLPSIYQRGEFARSALMFSNQLNKLMNGMYNRFPKLLGTLNTPEGREQMSGYLFSLALGGVGIWGIDNGKLPKSEEELQDMFLKTFLSSSGPVGGAISQGVQGYDYEIPIAGVVADTTRTILKAASGEDIKFYDVDQILTGTGLPITAAKRLARVYKEESLQPLYGPRKEETKLQFFD